jgi:hypothetical protein
MGLAVWARHKDCNPIKAAKAGTSGENNRLGVGRIVPVKVIVGSGLGSGIR